MKKKKTNLPSLLDSDGACLELRASQRPRKEKPPAFRPVSLLFMTYSSLTPFLALTKELALGESRNRPDVNASSHPKGTMEISRGQVRAAPGGNTQVIMRPCR